MKKYQAWRKAWNLGKSEAVFFLITVGLAAGMILECIWAIIIKTI
jgi:hypothetical protein